MLREFEQYVDPTFAEKLRKWEEVNPPPVVMPSGSPVRLVIDEHRGVLVFVEVWWGRALPTAEEVIELKQLGRLYVDAAFSLNAEFCAAGFNAKHGKNNLPYLVREWEETRQLYRVFVPFLPAEGGSADIEAAKKIALMRAVLQSPAEPEYPATAEVQILLGAL